MKSLKTEDNELLYRKIQQDFFRQVFSGEIAPGHVLPPERTQAESLSISRGTVRKAREIFIKEGFVTRIQGKGTLYTPVFNRRSDHLELIAVVVPVNNPFFLSFYSAFEKAAEEKDVLVLIKQLDGRNAGQLENVLFSLFLKGIRDVVFWPYDTPLKYEYIERLSGLGMNVVFFDNVRDYRFCDYVSVDNFHGISSLYSALKLSGVNSVAYIGWDTELLTSNLERENAFRTLECEKDLVIRLPWMKEQKIKETLEEHLNYKNLITYQGIKGFLCGNGHIGISLKEILLQNGFSHIPVYCMDNFSETEELGLTVYEQPFDEMGKRTFSLMLDRHFGEKEWHSTTNYIQGRIIKR